MWSVVLRIGIKAAQTTLLQEELPPLLIIRGVVCQPAIIKHPSGERFHIHPVSGEKITGCIIPYYDQAIALAKQAAMRIPESEKYRMGYCDNRNRSLYVGRKR